MSAPQIPNLLAGRGPGGLRGRGKHPLQAASDSAPEALKAQNDKIVQQTDADASISRASAVNAGLLDDAFAHDFAPAAAPSTVHRRFPIINRGRCLGVLRTTASLGWVCRHIRADASH